MTVSTCPRRSFADHAALARHRRRRRLHLRLRHRPEDRRQPPACLRRHDVGRLHLRPTTRWVGAASAFSTRCGRGVGTAVAQDKTVRVRFNQGGGASPVSAAAAQRCASTRAHFAERRVCRCCASNFTDHEHSPRPQPSRIVDSLHLPVIGLGWPREQEEVAVVAGVYVAGRDDGSPRAIVRDEVEPR